MYLSIALFTYELYCKQTLVSYCDNLNHNFFKYMFYKTVALNFPQQFRILFQC